MFWGIIGFLLGLGILALVLWLRAKNIIVKWYNWLIGGIGLLLLIFTVQNLLGCFIEQEEPAGWFFLLVVGLPSLIIMALACSLVIRGNRKAT